jgi:hypothetical protein
MIEGCVTSGPFLLLLFTCGGVHISISRPHSDTELHQRVSRSIACTRVRGALQSVLQRSLKAAAPSALLSGTFLDLFPSALSTDARWREFCLYFLPYSATFRNVPLDLAIRRSPRPQFTCDQASIILTVQRAIISINQHLVCPYHPKRVATTVVWIRLSVPNRSPFKWTPKRQKT